MVRISLKAARVNVEMTQEEMAQALGTNRVTYGQYESYDTPMRIDTAKKFSEITNIPMDSLIFLKDHYTSSVF